MNYLRPNSNETMAVSVSIHNSRILKQENWQERGFELQRHVSSVQDWASDSEVENTHYPEIRQLAKKLTGCNYALVSGHIRRNPEQASLHSDLAPITFVHSDFADSYGTLIKDHYQQADNALAQQELSTIGLTAATINNATRLIIIQFWRNLGPLKMDLPIAFCDARTIPKKSVRAIPVTDYAGGGFDFETLGVEAPVSPSEHLWHTYPEMNDEEIIVFRTYDSQLLGSKKPYWTPHSAFADPDVPQGNPARSSIELRATCIFV